MPPQDQGAYLAPLRTDAAALGQIGRTSGSNVYGNVELEPAARQVELQLTDPAKAHWFIRAARKLDPTIDTRLIRVVKAAYTRKSLDATRDMLFQRSQAHTLGYTVNMVAVDPGSASITVGVADPSAATALARVATPSEGPRSLAAVPTTNGIPMHFVHSANAHTTAWRDIKWHDSHPYVSGDVITDGQGGYCTAGLPAVTAGGADVMVTAGHCWPTGTEIYTGGGTVGGYDDSPGTTDIGYIYGNSPEWDSELINSPANNSDESDTSTWIPVTQGRSKISDLVRGS